MQPLNLVLALSPGETLTFDFGMAAMPFLCNGVLLDHFNLPTVIRVVFQMERNIMLVFLSHI